MSEIDPEHGASPPERDGDGDTARRSSEGGDETAAPSAETESSMAPRSAPETHGAPVTRSSPATRSSAAPSAAIALGGTNLKIAALVGCVAAVFAVYLRPGLRGIANDALVERCEFVTTVLAYSFAVLLYVLVFGGAVELARTARVGTWARVGGVATAGLVVSLSAPSLVGRLFPVPAVVLGLAASGAAAVGALQALRAPHTRAVGVVLAAFALAAIARIGAWELADVAGVRASPELYGVARGIASFAVVLEIVGELVAAIWLVVRGGSSGRFLSHAAVVGAFVLTWAAASGGGATAAPWRAVLHHALAVGGGCVPPADRLVPLATFSVSVALLLALASALVWNQVAIVTGALSLALLARGALDVPVHALAIAVAALWSAVAMADDGAMWRALIDTRAQRLAEGSRL